MIFVTSLLAASVALPNPPALAHDAQAPPKVERTVKMYISALDKNGQAVLNLTREEIQVVEDKREIQISAMKPAASEPLGVGVLIDVSGSERKNLTIQDPEALTTFLQAKLTSGGSVFVTTFGEVGNLVRGWTQSPSEISSAVQQAFKATRYGGSAVRDAIAWACDNETRGQAGDKVLLVMSDMEDNTSRHTQDAVVGAVLRANVGVFILAPNGKSPGPHDADSGRAYRAARDLSEETGGLAIRYRDVKGFREGLEHINDALAGRYSLEFVPAAPSLPFHKIKVKCTRKDVRPLAPSTYYIANK